MSTLKRKVELINRLQSLGFTFEESQQLRRIEMTLRRWAEMECGDGNDFASWAIERDETTGKPYRVTYPHNGKSYRTRISDRETGALKRLKAIMAAHESRRNASGVIGHALMPQLISYHQTDPRGCALYLIKTSELPKWTDEQIRKHSGEWPLHTEGTRQAFMASLYYSNGVAVYA